MIKDNRKLGNFDLTGIPSAPRGMPQIEVTFQIDANGILEVLAQDKGTGKLEKITIENDSNRFTQKEIEKMVKDAENFAADDKKVLKKVYHIIASTQNIAITFLNCWLAFLHQC